MVKKFKIKYYLGGDIRVKYIEAEDSIDARLKFYLFNDCDDIISIEESDV